MEPERPPARPTKSPRSPWRWVWRVATLALLPAIVAFFAWWTMIWMPGDSYRGALAPLDGTSESLSDELRRHVVQLAGDMGERNLRNSPQLEQARTYVKDEFAAAGYQVAEQSYREPRSNLDAYNIEATIAGSSQPEEIVIVGAHYDSVVGSPGANDNASGTAAVLALAKRLANCKCDRTLRFVLFTNEEPPYFQTPSMGSAVYARRSRERNEKLTAVVSIETIGYFTSEPATQQYPQPFGLFYPSEGDFIAVIGNVGSRQLVREVIDSFRRHAKFPSEGGAVPGEIHGVGWSDHWSFWQEGYQAVMITDTAPFRYPHYHTEKDTPDKLNFDHMARIVSALELTIDDLVDVKEQH